MFIHFSKLQTVGVALFLLTACVGEADGIEEEPEASRAVSQAGTDQDDKSTLSTIAENIDTMSGERIIVRGFLTNFAPALILVKNEDSNVFDDPAIIVMDRYLREMTLANDDFVDESGFLAAKGCRDRYVEIEGGVEFLPQYEANGIANIFSISTFSNNGYAGAPVTCYERR